MMKKGQSRSFKCSGKQGIHRWGGGWIMRTALDFHASGARWSWPFSLYLCRCSLPVFIAWERKGSLCASSAIARISLAWNFFFPRMAWEGTSC